MESWLTRDLPGCDPDHTVDLRKRLAKAHELVAKANGRDSSIYHEEWKQLIALQKRMVQERASSGVRVEHWPPKSHRTSSRARAGSSRRRPSKFIPALDEFLAQPFVAADFETANRSSGVSACQIALVRVESGRVVDRFNTLLKPPSSFGDFEFTYLHGISARDTRTAPSWPDIVPAIRAFAGCDRVCAQCALRFTRVEAARRVLPHPVAARSLLLQLPHRATHDAGPGQLSTADGARTLCPALRAGPSQGRFRCRSVCPDCRCAAIQSRALCTA